MSVLCTRPTKLDFDVAVVMSTVELRALASEDFDTLIRPASAEAGKRIGLSCGGEVVGDAWLAEVSGPHKPAEVAAGVGLHLSYEEWELAEEKPLWGWQFTEVRIFTEPVELSQRSRGLWSDVTELGPQAEKPGESQGPDLRSRATAEVRRRRRGFWSK